jgi:hypothetical protein
MMRGWGLHLEGVHAVLLTPPRLGALVGLRAHHGVEAIGVAFHDRHELIVRNALRQPRTHERHDAAVGDAALQPVLEGGPARRQVPAHADADERQAIGVDLGTSHQVINGRANDPLPVEAEGEPLLANDLSLTRSLEGEAVPTPARGRSGPGDESVDRGAPGRPGAGSRGTAVKPEIAGLSVTQTEYRFVDTISRLSARLAICRQSTPACPAGVEECPVSRLTRGDTVSQMCPVGAGRARTSWPSRGRPHGG